MEQNETVLVDAEVVSTEVNEASNQLEASDGEQQLEIKEEEQAAPAPFKRVIVIAVTLDQKGIKNSDGELVDPDNNTFKEILVTMSGSVDIARVAGRIAQDLHNFHMSLAGTKGIKRGAGFNINLKLQDNAKSDDADFSYESISKVRMSNPVDVAFKIASALLTQCGADNAEALLTGNFKVSEEGKLLIQKMGMNEMLEIAPEHIVKKEMDIRRKDINRNLKEVKKAIADKQ